METAKVSMFIHRDNCNWNVETLNLYLPSHIINLVVSIPLCLNTQTEDKPLWPFAKRHCSVKSAYASLTRIDRNVDNWLWIWHLNIPPKIRIFFWKVVHNRLPTKSNLVWLASTHCKIMKLLGKLQIMF